MFKRIRNKITLFNTLTLIAFLIIFILIIIFIIKINLENSGEQYLKNLANTLISDEDSGSDYNLANTTFHEKIGYNYIIWKDNSSIIAQNTNQSNLIEHAHQLLLQGPSINESFKKINISSGDYRVYSKEYFNNRESFTIQVFQDISAENEIISYFITYLIFIGFIGIIFIIPISFLLAGKSLVPVKKSFDDQKQFIADASHELRSPLTVIQTSLDVLEIKEDQTIKENMKWINNISVECNNMSELISQLLMIAQADSDKLAFKLEKVNMSETTKEVTDLLRETADVKEIRIKTKIQPDLILSGDKGKLSQLVRIFLDNAIKYSNNNSDIYVTLKTEKKSLILEVEDHGIGIAQEDIEKIFDRFYRCDEARTRTEGGNGLGLNIAQTIIDHYNGKINTFSTPGKGTKFQILLPI